MTYGYGPHEWQPSVPEDDPDALYYREPPTVPPGYPRHSQAAQGQQPEPPTNPWQSAQGDSGAPGQGGTRRGVPQAPPPARHVAPAGGLPAQPTYSPTSPARPTSPAYPTSTPPSVRRPPPNNQGSQPPAYPAYPPPVPTSPTVPRSTPGPAPRPPLPQGRAGAPPTGAPGAPPMAGPGARPGPPVTGPGGPIARPGAPVARPGGPPLRPGPPVGRQSAPPQAPGRRGAGAPAPLRRGLPPPPRSRALSLREVPGIIRQLPQHKPWMVALGAIAVAVVIAVCSLGSFMLVKDENAVIGAPTTPETTVVKRDISSREKDPIPLTPADVFPNAEIIADPAYPPYVRVGEVQAANDCRVAATGEVGKRLLALQCNQVIRASFSTPDNNYFVTGGIFNLPDTETAGTFSAEVPGLIDANQGAITGYASNPNVNVVLVRAPTNVTWEVRGHFVVYTVIAKKDGSAFEPDDAGAKVITYDILRTYLRDTVLDQWSIDKTAQSATGSASPSS